VDIETNSTIDVEATEDQKNVADFMNAMAQLMAGIGPMIQNGAMPFEAGKALMLAVVRKYRFGTEVEDEFKAMTAPQQSNPDADKAKQELAQHQQDSQIAIQEKTAEHQRSVAEMQQSAQQEMQALQQKAMQEQADLAQKAQSEHEALVAQIQQEREALAQEFNLEQQKIDGEKQIKQMQANIQRDTELKKTAMTIAGQIQIAKINTVAKQQQESENAQEEASKNEESDNAMNAVMETQAKLLAAITAPKKIMRDGQGKATGIQTVGAET